MMNKLKIGYFADGPWSHQAFELLIKDQSFDIRFIVPRVNTRDNTLQIYAAKYRIDYLFPVKINSDSFIENVKKYDCDLFVSMSFDQIFRKKTIDLPKMGTINCHAGKLPFYRGRNILNWAIINDEKVFGITVHFVDEGIDTGDIILQRSFPIIDDDDYGTLLEKAYKECAIILYDALKELHNGTFQRINQTSIHPVGFYCGKREPGDELINWNSTSRNIFNFIRALAKPGPIASTHLKSSIVKINKSRLIPDAPKYINRAGQILSKTENGFLVKTIDSFIEIFDIESEIKLKVGDRFEL